MSVIGNLDLIGLVSVAKDMVGAGLEKHYIEHAAGDMYVLRSGDAYTHWFRFTGDISKSTTFHKMTHIYKDYYILYQYGQIGCLYNCVTKNSKNILYQASIDFINDGRMAAIMQIFDNFNLSASLAFHGKVSSSYQDDGHIYIWCKLHYNYIFAHLFPQKSAHAPITFRVSKQSEIAPYLNRIASLNVLNTAHTFGCCELTERYLNSKGIVFPFKADELTKISLADSVYTFHYGDKKVFKLRIDGNKLAPMVAEQVQYDGHMPSSFYIEQAIKKIDELIKKEAKSGSNPVCVPYHMILNSRPIITWLDNLCKKHDYERLFDGDAYGIYLYGSPN